jgi:hypothetical protein
LLLLLCLTMCLPACLPKIPILTLPYPSPFTPILCLYTINYTLYNTQLPNTHLPNTQHTTHSFSDFQRSIVSKYFLRQYNLKRTSWVKLQEKASFFLLPAYTLCMIWFVYVFNLSIGSRATNLWLTVTFLGLSQDVVLLQPAKIWINFVVISSSVSKHVRKLCERLSLRSRLMMMRTSGMMRYADCPTQHFNPACRAARRFPHLPIARLLMTMNDTDLLKAKLPNPYLLPFTYCSAGLFAIAYLPEVLQETLIDVVSGAGIDFGMIGMYAFGKASLIACVVVAALVVVAFVCRELYVKGQWQRERFTAMRTYQEQQREKEEQGKFDDVSQSQSQSQGPGSAEGKQASSMEKMELGVSAQAKGRSTRFVDADEYKEAAQEEGGSVWANRRSPAVKSPFDPSPSPLAPEARGGEAHPVSWARSDSAVRRNPMSPMPSPASSHAPTRTFFAHDTVPVRVPSAPPAPSSITSDEEEEADAPSLPCPALPCPAAAANGSEKGREVKRAPAPAAPVSEPPRSPKSFEPDEPGSNKLPAFVLEPQPHEFSRSKFEEGEAGEEEKKGGASVRVPNHIDPVSANTANRHDNFAVEPRDEVGTPPQSQNPLLAEVGKQWSCESMDLDVVRRLSPAPSARGQRLLLPPLHVLPENGPTRVEEDSGENEEPDRLPSTPGAPAVSSSSRFLSTGSLQESEC